MIVFYYSFLTINTFSVTFIDVGQGNATLFETANNFQFLIDSGNGLAAKTSLSKKLNFFDKELDLILATHFDLDHVGNFPYLLSNFNISYFFDTGITNEKDVFELINKKILKKNVLRKKLSAGDILKINPHTKIEIFFPPPNINIQSFQDNSSSLVLKITHQNSSVLITGDSPAKIEKFLVKKYGEKLKADILLAGHHGSKTSSSEIFLKTVRPEYIIFSAGKDNSYKHPHKEVLERAQKLGLKILRTDQLGSINFIYKDGKLNLNKK